MANYFRGDTLPIVVSYDNYTFKQGDVVTGAILDEKLNILTQVSLTVPDECNEVQLEFSREQMHDIQGNCIIEVRTLTANDDEITIQKNITLREDGIR